MSSSDEYSLNWSNHTNHIKKAFGNLFSGSEFVDVTLSCEGKKITAHKMLLSACSVYFHDVFRDNPCQHPIVIFKDVKYQNLVNILKFIYCGEASVATEDFDDFLKTAELLQISGLTDEDTRNSMTEKEEEVSETTNVITGNNKQVQDDSTLEREAVVRKRRNEVSNIVDTVEKKVKVGENDFNIEIKQEEIILMDESSTYVEQPLEFEINHESTKGHLLQLVTEVERNILPSNEENICQSMKLPQQNLYNKKVNKKHEWKNQNTIGPNSNSIEINCQISADEFSQYCNEKKLVVGWPQWIQKKLKGKCSCEFKGSCYTVRTNKKAVTAHFRGHCSPQCPVKYFGKIQWQRDANFGEIIIRIERCCDSFCTNK
ncbi:hypothetical protein FQA39_LY16084 [Lamprigera yunnana]|nr:hypothetical protein FQA39_LY16084 [Lamprigera yunnana]